MHEFTGESVQECVKRINKPEGTYTLIYGKHTKMQPAEQLPKDIDAVVLETGTDSWVDPIELVSSYKYHPQYDELMSKIEERRIPVITADPTPRVSYSSFISLNGLAPILLEYVFGLAVIYKSMDNLLSRNTSRRGFLMGGLRLGLGLRLTEPLLDHILIGNLPECSFPGIEKTTQKIHPEIDTYIIGVRNLVIAYKEQALMESIGKRPHLVTVMGSAHVGLEDAILATPQENLDGLSGLIPRVSIGAFAVPEAFYKAAKLIFDGSNWKVENIYEFPKLKEMVS